ncbi:DUF1059 domain-containing protein [Metallosphaera hakonensis]|uniref:Small metal-binding protein n=1 Tax=Metallosphaera hakonensis JCM 8857 = DSM 7519 TaxID=1293036 RepID=A0A2U9IR15_9CREN|nr:DUF1059 domain-containing protein [Metallosphaera hakonensis]AWR98455.1 DUF1059 domain-containing protein [Metallosphaera hakonensis JCM 8857 = DSM 7519]
MVLGFGKKKKLEFSCSSLGMSCGFEVKGSSSEQELLDILKVHAKTAHNMTEISNDLLGKIKQNIKKV